jgi:predicted flap endonuclease-1-like 5' DNA nuclease
MMRQVFAEQPTEVHQLRVEIAKWRQRVSKLIESLRVRGESLVRAEGRNRQLLEELEEMRQRVAAAGTARMSAGLTEPGGEVEHLLKDRARLENELTCLANRNRLLQETIAILNVRLADAVEEIGTLRSMRQDRPSRDPQPRTDDVRILLRIRGIGEKTLGLLQEAGIHSVESLAELGETTLDDPGSPLFPLRTRIRKQCWIRQARELLGRVDPQVPASRDVVPVDAAAPDQGI